MSEIHKIVEVKALGLKTLFLKFSDGKSGSFAYDDFFTYKGMLEPLKDQNFFNKVEVVDGTIAWPGEIDFCPDVLYSIVTKEKIYYNNKVVFDPSLGKNAWL